MVTLEVKGQNVPLASVDMVLDLQEYYMYFLVRTVIPIPPREQVTFKSDSNESVMYVRESRYYEPTYELKLISEEQFTQFKLKTNPFQGEDTVGGVLSKVGAKSFIEQDTDKSWWMIPSVSLVSLIRTLNKYAVPSNGGAPRFYMDLQGKIQYIDLVLLAKEEPKVMECDVLDDHMSDDWGLEVPGRLQILASSVESKLYDEVVLDEEQSSGLQLTIDTTGRYAQLVKQAYVNDYTWRKYTSRKLIVQNIVSTPHSVGQYVSVSGIKGVVLSFRQPIPINNESVMASALVVCPE